MRVTGYKKRLKTVGARDVSVMRVVLAIGVRPAMGNGPGTDDVENTLAILQKE